MLRLVQCRFLCSLPQLMPPTHLAYANVVRQFPFPPPPGIKNFHDMKSCAKADYEQQMIMYRLDENGKPVQFEHVSKRAKISSDPPPQRRPVFTIEVPNSQGRDWVFPGKLSDPKLLEQIEKASKGWTSDGMLPTARLSPGTSKKEKKKQERLDAAMKKLAETDNKERIIGRKSRAGKRKKSKE